MTGLRAWVLATSWAASVAVGACGFTAGAVSVAGVDAGSHDAPHVGQPDAPAIDLCGNGVLDAGEECDDGNRTAGDGCGATCQIEPGYRCPPTGACALVTGLAFTSAEDLPPAGTSTGGGAFLEPCPTGATIVGFAGDLANDGMSIGTLHSTCAVISFAGGGAITWSAVTQTGNRGSENTGTIVPTLCANSMVSVGFVANAGAYLDGLELICAPISFVHGALAFGAPSTLANFGGGSGTTLPAAQCAPGEVTSTFEGDSGSVIDHFGLRCATVAATP